LRNYIDKVSNQAPDRQTRKRIYDDDDRTKFVNEETPPNAPRWTRKGYNGSLKLFVEKHIDEIGADDLDYNAGDEVGSNNIGGNDDNRNEIGGNDDNGNEIGGNDDNGNEMGGNGETADEGETGRKRRSRSVVSEEYDSDYNDDEDM